MSLIAAYETGGTASHGRTETPAQGVATVLCIDDDPDVGRGIQIGLAAHRIGVLTAYSGIQGIWLAMTHKPDAVITDIAMPSGNGDDVVACLRRNADTRAIPLIVISGRADHALRKRLLSDGVEKWLTKPVDHAELLDALRPLIPSIGLDSPLGRADEAVDSSLAGRR